MNILDTSHSEQLIQFLSHPFLKQFTKKYTAGQYLFRQGQAADTLYIILEGSVRLVGEQEDEEHVEAVLERGQFLGEKAVMSETPHRRFFSAVVQRSVTVAELRSVDLEQIRIKHPELMMNILQAMLAVASGRLDRANYLARLLRSSDNIERLVQLIVYYSHTSGKKIPGGLEFVLTEESIHSHIDMDPTLIHECIEKLIQRRLLARSTNDYFLMKDEREVLTYLPELQKFANDLRAAAA